MAVTRHQRGRAQVVRADGALDHENAKELATQLQAAVAVPDVALVVDFLDVDAVDAVVLAVLTRYKRLTERLQRPMILVAEHPDVQLRLSISGLDKRLRVATAADEAAQLGYLPRRR